MKNEILYQKTVQILEDAYMNDTLMHGNCCACAVGNIIAAGCEYKVEKEGVRGARWMYEGKEVAPSWNLLFMTARGVQKINKNALACDWIVGEINNSAYEWQELATIERAFETASIGENDDEWMFNGLIAVIDALDIIHENTDEIATVSTKKRFSKI